MCMLLSSPAWDTLDRHLPHLQAAAEAEETQAHHPPGTSGRLCRCPRPGRRTTAAGQDAHGGLRGTEPPRLPHPDGQAVAAPAADHQVAAVIRRRGLTYSDFFGTAPARAM